MKLISLACFTVGTIMAIWADNTTATFLVFGAAILAYYVGEALANKPEK